MHVTQAWNTSCAMIVRVMYMCIRPINVKDQCTKSLLKMLEDYTIEHVLVLPSCTNSTLTIEFEY